MNKSEKYLLTYLRAVFKNLYPAMAVTTVTGEITPNLYRKWRVPVVLLNRIIWQMRSRGIVRYGSEERGNLDEWLGFHVDDEEREPSSKHNPVLQKHTKHKKS